MAVTANTQGLVTNQFLTQIARSYPVEGLAGHVLAPKVSVNRTSDKIRDFGREDANSLPVRSDGAAYEEVRSIFSEINYTAKIFSGKETVSRRSVRNQDSAWDALGMATKKLAKRAMLTHEVEVADLFTASGNYQDSNFFTTLSAGAQWDDANGGDPVNDLRTGQNAMWTNAGITPDIMVCDYKTANYLLAHPLVGEVLNPTGRFTFETDAGMFPLPVLGMKLFVAKTVARTSVKKASEASPTFSSIWGDNVVLAKVDPPGEGVAFTYTLTVEDMRTRRVWDDEIEAWKVLMDYEFAIPVVSSNAAYLIQDALSASA